jgi:glycosyltransferase involved in cell wall biosynthesis
MDATPESMKDIWIRKTVNQFFFRFADVIQIEASKSYERMFMLYPNSKERILLASNPITNDWFTANGFFSPQKKDKENLVITVARIGVEQKNNEMMLEALDGMDVNGWKFIFVGPIANDFKSKIKSFFERNPKLKENICFVGNITDKKELYSYYKKAKVFCLTSHFETNANSQMQALYFGLFNISTPVSGWEDISDKGKLGVTIHTAWELHQILSDLFSGKIDPCAQMEAVMEHAKNFYLPKICEMIYGAIQGEKK